MTATKGRKDKSGMHIYEDGYKQSELDDVRKLVEHVLMSRQQVLESEIRVEDVERRLQDCMREYKLRTGEGHLLPGCSDQANTTGTFSFTRFWAFLLASLQELLTQMNVLA